MQKIAEISDHVISIMQPLVFFFFITWSGSSLHWPVLFLDNCNLYFALAQWRLGLVRVEVKAKRKSRLGRGWSWLIASS